ncbi:Sua5/YciO/YrdC/YwlC family protein, partial [archaeon]
MLYRLGIVVLLHRTVTVTSVTSSNRGFSRVKPLFRSYSIPKRFSSIRTIQFETNQMDYHFALIEPNEEGIAEAATRLRSGELLAFPTETVYGLGANALNEVAVLSIFKAKGRPLTDPLIVHIAYTSDAYRLIDIDEVSRKVFDALATKFWPGPLTIIVKASSLIPLTVTANTGFVGVRCPKHE